MNADVAINDGDLVFVRSDEMQNLNQDMAYALAQELVDKSVQMKILRAETLQLKLEIFDAARGGIQCNGGRVLFVDSGVTINFDKDRLKDRLISQLNLTDEEAESFIDGCKAPRDRVAYISVTLD